MPQRTAANTVMGWGGAFMAVVCVSAIARSSWIALQAVAAQGEARPSLWKIWRPVFAAGLISLMVSGGIIAFIAAAFR